MPAIAGEHETVQVNNIVDAAGLLSSPKLARKTKTTAWTSESSSIARTIGLIERTAPRGPEAHRRGGGPVGRPPPY